MILIFSFIFCWIYFVKRRTHIELSYREIPTIFSDTRNDYSDQKQLVKKVVMRYVLPCCIITGIVSAVGLIFSDISVLIYIVAAYVLSYGYTKKVQKINKLDGEEIYYGKIKSFFRRRKRER